MAFEAALILIITFLILLLLGVPIAITIAVSSLSIIILNLPLDVTMFTASQKIVTSLNSFTLISIPLFIMSGIIMNNGGIAKRLIKFSMLLVGRIPGALAITNAIGNGLFGSMSSSAIAASTAIGGVLVPQQIEAGYDKGYAAAANIASAPSGMVTPPSTAFIMYSLVSGASISALFLGGYLVGAAWVLVISLISFILAKKNKYPVVEMEQNESKTKIILDAIPSLLLIFIVIGGILSGFFTAIEASAVCVAYSLVLSMVYKTIKIKNLPNVFRQTVETSGTIMLLLATSSLMSFGMALNGIPDAVSSLVLGISTSPFFTLLIINIVFLIVGCFMDVGPAILIFTPIFLPIVQEIGIDPVHFGLFAILNFSVGSITPPVGTGLYVGASIANVKFETVIKPLLPFYLAILALLLLITYFPQLVMWFPNLIAG